MRCRRVEHLLSQDPTDARTGRRATAVAAHLRDCPACRRLQEDLVAVEHEVRAIAALHAAPRPDLRRRAIDQHVASLPCAVRSARGAVGPELSYRAPSTEHRALPLRPRLALPAGAAVVAFLLAALGLTLLRRGQERTSGPRSLPIARQVRLRPLDATPRSASAPGTGDRRHRVVVVRPKLIETPVGVLNRLEKAPAGANAAARRLTQTMHPRPTEHAPGLLMSVSDGAVLGHRRWAMLPSTEWQRLEDSVRRAVPVRDDFVRIPFPQVASASDGQIAEAVESYKREAAVVDSRLAGEITLQQKATALSDLCERLRADTGIQLGAGSSVADEKVTIFCGKVPLRDVMRQLSRPFGYTWLRSGKTGEYKYELVQDLRSQLLEEELRNRDRNGALLSLEKEIDRYRPYLGLSPDEALARSGTAPPEEKKLLEALAGTGWGPLHIYSRLSRQDMTALRTGQRLIFSQEPQPGEQPLPPDLAHGVLQSVRGWRRVKKADEGFTDTTDLTDPRALAVSAVPEARAKLSLEMPQSEVGQFALNGLSGFFTPWGSNIFTASVNPLAVGMSPTVLKPENATVNAKLVRDPALRPRVTVQPEPSCRPILPVQMPGTPPGAAEGSAPEPKVTSADLLEVLHRATGLPIVADYYTRLYTPSAVSVRNMPLFDALNHLSDAMRLRWHRDREGGWLQFRSTSYFNDRLKEVPNHLLARWAVARRQHGFLTVDDLIEIAQLPDAQLDAKEMAEGSRLCFRLAEWDLARDGALRPHLRYLAGFTPAQRQEAMSPAGLPFTRMSLAQQQQFIAFALFGGPLGSLEELAGATLRVNYTLPGWYQWGNPDGPLHYSYWVVPFEWGLQGKRVPRPPVRERTREAALQALRRVDPEIREALLQYMRRVDPRLQAAPPDDEAQIFPTKLNLTILYVPGATNARGVRVAFPGSDYVSGGAS